MSGPAGSSVPPGQFTPGNVVRDMHITYIVGAPEGEPRRRTEEAGDKSVARPDEPRYWLAKAVADLRRIPEDSGGTQLKRLAASARVAEIAAAAGMRSEVRQVVSEGLVAVRESTAFFLPEYVESLDRALMELRQRGEAQDRGGVEGQQLQKDSLALWTEVRNHPSFKVYPDRSAGPAMQLDVLIAVREGRSNEADATIASAKDFGTWIRLEVTRAKALWMQGEKNEAKSRLIKVRDELPARAKVFARAYADELGLTPEKSPKGRKETIESETASFQRLGLAYVARCQIEWGLDEDAQRTRALQEKIVGGFMGDMIREKDNTSLVVDRLLRNGQLHEAVERLAPHAELWDKGIQIVEMYADLRKLDLAKGAAIRLGLTESEVEGVKLRTEMALCVAASRFGTRSDVESLDRINRRIGELAKAPKKSNYPSDADGLWAYLRNAYRGAGEFAIADAMGDRPTRSGRDYECVGLWFMSAGPSVQAVEALQKWVDTEPDAVKRVEAYCGAVRALSSSVTPRP